MGSPGTDPAATVRTETPSPYDRLCALPEGLTGEIIDGRLYTEPRPAGPHGYTELALGSRLFLLYGRGEGGPGGWWILVEPEIHFVRDREVLVPDLAGWRRERMPAIPREHRFETVPDWVCEILSPATRSKDRELKMPTYAKYGVPYLWLIDPTAKRLEAYALQAGTWTLLGAFEGNAEVRVAPFDAVPLRLGDLWVD